MSGFIHVEVLIGVVRQWEHRILAIVGNRNQIWHRLALVGTMRYRRAREIEVVGGLSIKPAYRIAVVNPSFAPNIQVFEWTYVLRVAIGKFPILLGGRR